MTNAHPLTFSVVSRLLHPARCAGNTALDQLMTACVRPDPSARPTIKAVAGELKRIPAPILAGGVAPVRPLLAMKQVLSLSPRGNRGA
jgi:hypothetical protein